MTTSTGHRLVPQLRRMALQAESAITDAELLSAFVNQHDETAFVAIVQRHGPMVRQVCMRLVGDPHLAEDAFQATFMVLARRAASVQPRELLGHWLYGVARRTALKARVGYWRQRSKEKQVDVMPQSPVTPEELWTDLQPVLDEELAQLSEKHRTLLVLCDLEGRPQRQVARELKLPPATVANRLAAARKALAKRLTGRGIALSTATLATALQGHHVGATIPSGCATELAQWASRVALGEPLAGVVPPMVNQLTEGVLKMFVVAKLKKAAIGVASSLLLAAGFTTIATSPLSAEPIDQANPTKTVPAKPAPPKPETIDDLTFLRRISLDLRGILPTAIEINYFTTDADKNKRGKVTEWLLLDQPKKAEGIERQGLLWLQHKHTAWTNAETCAACHQGMAWKTWADVKQPNFAWGLDRHMLWANIAEKIDAHRQPVMRWASKVEPTPVLGERLNTNSATVDVEPKQILELRSELDVLEFMLKESPSPETKARAYDIFQRIQAVDTSTKEDTFRFYLGLAEPSVSKEHLRIYLAPTRTATDEEFLKRAFIDIVGMPPTKLEERYFLTDKDTAKRDKLLNWLLTQARSNKPHDKVFAAWIEQPAMRQKWIADWKARLDTIEQRLAIATQSVSPTNRLDQLLHALLQAKRSDPQILESLMLATMGRLPTETERQLIVEGLPRVGDRLAAWQNILRTLINTSDAKAHAKTLGDQTTATPKK